MKHLPNGIAEASEVPANNHFFLYSADVAYFMHVFCQFTIFIVPLE